MGGGRGGEPSHEGVRESGSVDAYDTQVCHPPNRIAGHEQPGAEGWRTRMRASERVAEYWRIRVASFAGRPAAFSSSACKDRRESCLAAALRNSASRSETASHSRTPWVV